MKNNIFRSLTPYQYVVIAICFLCNMLDGMDVLIISYAAPAIAKAWSLSPEALGVIFSSGLIGMSVGAVIIAPYADKLGRKPMMLIAPFIMGLSIFLTSYASSINQLMLLRFISGIGIGIMMATTASITAEYSPKETRGFWVSFVVAGYPVGAVITGLVSASIISNYGWEYLFKIAGIVSFIVLPIIAIYLKEPTIEKTASEPKKIAVNALFEKNYRTNTILLWSALFLCFTTLYFLINWIPKLASDAGLSDKLAIYAGTVFNFGAIVGIPIQGWLSTRFGLNKTVSYILIITSVFLVTFGFFKGSDLMIVNLFLLGFGVQAGFVGLYAIAASLYHAKIRTTGVGWAVGLGRIGGIIGPVLGGILVGFGFGMIESFIAFALPVLLAGILTHRIKM
ncbi:aromatic acid/H+ symport family MFS transporter [Flavobacteriaceae bacterium XHP0103]|uniref:MFS transporter n=1 Tax=Marixanthotalea marina TaxID=2844359 RepID=UPI002989BB65|nr:aromatic acid/H+ symport family MFS transporter [Marixanthotalea marina]MBU3820769.1 aromatic acid/H+ symport family MFS transporter [Marixanthotalea marina]